VMLVAVPFAMYFSPWYTAYFHSAGIRELTYLALIIPGLVFFWTLIRADPVPWAYPYLVTLWIMIGEVIGDAILGVAVISDSHLIGGPYYRGLARPWGPSLRFDQMLGGATLWVLGDLVGIPFLVAALIYMIREDETEAAAVDAELDARDAAAAATASAASAGSAATAGSASSSASSSSAAASEQPAGSSADRPWWESDPRFTGRFRPAEPSQDQ